VAIVGSVGCRNERISISAEGICIWELIWGCASAVIGPTISVARPIRAAATIRRAGPVAFHESERVPLVPCCVVALVTGALRASPAAGVVGAATLIMPCVMSLASFVSPHCGDVILPRQSATSMNGDASACAVTSVDPSALNCL
jgi:hypothetical protein